MPKNNLKSNKSNLYHEMNKQIFLNFLILWHSAIPFKLYLKKEYFSLYYF